MYSEKAARRNYRFSIESTTFSLILISGSLFLFFSRAFACSLVNSLILHSDVTIQNLIILYLGDVFVERKKKSFHHFFFVDF